MNAQNWTFQGVGYFDILRAINERLQPRSFFEIGTNIGESALCFTCNIVMVDPEFQITRNVMKGRKTAFLFQMTSDDFFRDYHLTDFLPHGPDVAFLDGMHRFEFLLRDFINTERSCHDKSIIIMHDCLPTNERMAERVPRIVEDEDPSTRGSWAGDVWRIIPALKKHRPDLRIHLLDCPPTGLVVCTKVDPKSDLLSNNYYKIIDEFSVSDLGSYGISALRNEYPMVSSRVLLERPWDLARLFTVC
jgi:hypothetical protein